MDLKSVYVASKLYHAPMWRTLRESWKESGFNIVSRWIDEPAIVAGNFNDEGIDASVFSAVWRRNMTDLARADAVVCYAHEGDQLRGALVEIGAGLMFDLPIVLSGWRSDVKGVHGSWQFHPLVCWAPHIDNVPVVLTELLKAS